MDQHVDSSVEFRTRLRSHGVMQDRDEFFVTREHELAGAAEQAERLNRWLGDIAIEHGQRVHFRVGSRGIAMVGLTPDRPQRGKSGIRVEAVRDDFEAYYVKHCVDVRQGRPTKEKSLQSFLLRNANASRRSMSALRGALHNPTFGSLRFLTDELSLSTAAGRVVCDLLAIKRDGVRTRPVVIELKSARSMKRLVEQTKGYAALIDAHQQSFARLASCLLREEVELNGPCERWIIWPATLSEREPREAALAKERIRVIGYRETAEEGIDFQFGPDPHAVVAQIKLCVPEGQEALFPACFAASRGDWSAMPDRTSFDDMHHLAYAIHGYDVSELLGFGHPAHLLRDRTERFQRCGRFRGSAAELWCALFFQARSFDYAAYEEFPTGESWTAWQALYSALAQQVRCGDGSAGPCWRRCAASRVCLRAVGQSRGPVPVTHHARASLRFLSLRACIPT